MARKIKIINKTKWQTRHLRAFVVRIARDVMPDERALRVTFYVGRRGNFTRGDHECTGWAYYHSGVSRIGVPTEVCKLDLAHTIAHELGHNAGFTHAQMKGSPIYTYAPGWQEQYAWAESMPLEKRLEKTKARLTGVDLALAKAAKAEAKLAAIDRKIKRLTTLRKKWTAKLRYYQRRQKIAANPTTGERP